jgi:hypothetical protein
MLSVMERQASRAEGLAAEVAMFRVSRANRHAAIRALISRLPCAGRTQRVLQTSDFDHSAVAHIVSLQPRNIPYRLELKLRSVPRSRICAGRIAPADSPGRPRLARVVLSGAVNCVPHAVQAAMHGTERKCLTILTARSVSSSLRRERSLEERW